MTPSLLQAIVALAGVGAASALAAVHVITGSDALAVISAVVGYSIHAGGVASGKAGP